jgi:magnesium transporter
MITYYFRTVKDDVLKTLTELRTGIWIHAEAPSESELQDLFGKLGLDTSIVEDAQDFFEVPRLERVEGATYFFTRYPYAEKAEDTDTAPLLIVMGESCVLTVSQRPVPQFARFIAGDTTVVTTQKTKLFIHFMQAITNDFERQLVRLRKAVHRDRARLRRIGNKEIVQFVNYEHKLNDMIAAIVPTNTALRQITKGNFMPLYNDDVELMEDLMIDNGQLVDSARSVLNTIQNVRGATEAILTNNLNTTIKTLTVLTILLTIPTIIASLFGMNVPLPLAESQYAFALVLGSITAVVGVVVWWFKRNGWL